MTKQMPKYMIEKINRMNKLMQQVCELNSELETWLEENDVTCDGFDFTYDYRESRGYEIYDLDGFVKEVNENLA